jgi:transcriptional regulator with XRE-family HTH domain
MPDEKLVAALAERLREHRKKQGLSQEELADLVGLDRTYISLLETGKRDNPTLDTLADLAQVLQISASDLLMQDTHPYFGLLEFCAEYTIGIGSLVHILRDPKVMPMIRGKGFEFGVEEKLQRILDPRRYTISAPFINPQSGTEKTDVEIIRVSDQRKFRIECKLAQKGEFQVLPHSGGFRLRVKCMRSRTLGEEAAGRMSRKTGRSQTDHFTHSDQYLPQEFDFVVTSLANAFFETDEFGNFVWQPSSSALLFLKALDITTTNQASQKMFVAKSSSLAALKDNQVECSRQICDNKTNCGFIPNYPKIFFDVQGRVQTPWYPLEDIESLFDY